MANYQQEVSAHHNMPLSVGFGAGYRLGNHRIHFSTEWFDKVDRFDILDTEDFIGQSSGETFSNQVDNELKSILNYGFGFKFYISERLNLYLSYITDFSAYVPDAKTNRTVSTWDIYHISTGASFAIGRSEFTLGDLFQNSDVDYNRLKFLIGFSIEI